MKKILSKILKIGIIIVVGGGLMLVFSDSSTESPGNKTSVNISEEKTTKETKMTLNQKNAVKSAELYLETTPFSRKGLVNQLTSDYGSKFEKEDAEWAIKYLEKKGKVNWKEQAVKAAKIYLETMPLSKEKLINQLSSDYGDKFSVEEAKYGANRAFEEFES